MRQFTSASRRGISDDVLFVVIAAALRLPPGRRVKLSLLLLSPGLGTLLSETGMINKQFSFVKANLRLAPDAKWEVCLLPA